MNAVHVVYLLHVTNMFYLIKDSGLNHGALVVFTLPRMVTTYCHYTVQWLNKIKYSDAFYHFVMLNWKTSIYLNINN